MDTEYNAAQSVSSDKRRYLFIRQVETLNSFLANGAISRAQYDFSYRGLVTKMNITEDELSEWLNAKPQQIKERENDQ